MTVTGLHVRKRLRRQVVRLLDGLIARLEREDVAPTESVAPPAPERTPAPSPAPAAAAPAAPTQAAAPPPPAKPLPELPKRPTPLGSQGSVATAPPPAPVGGTTPAAERARLSPEERQKQHWQRTRQGILRFVHERGGRAGLRELHDHSERTYFVAHVGFSRLMEELTGEGLLHYDHDTAVASITDAGRAALVD